MASWTAVRTVGGSWYTVTAPNGKSVMVSASRGVGQGRHTEETAMAEGRKIIEARAALAARNTQAN